MTWFLGILAAGAFFALFAYILKVRSIVSDLADSLQEERRFLLQERSTRLQHLGFNGVIRQMNQLVDRCVSVKQEESGYSNQIEAVLGSIQEAVLIFDDSRMIEYANESARRLFQVGRPIKGAKLESFLRSPSLLDFLGNPMTGRETKLHQISLDWRGEPLWFEVSCAMVESIDGSGPVSTILVLHDITRLKSLEMVRRDFVANVSHELRTPLTIIKGFAETLTEDSDDLSNESKARL
jgi:two-component system phosphate regulon sensor histidine kinase PhoR